MSVRKKKDMPLSTLAALLGTLTRMIAERSASGLPDQLAERYLAASNSMGDAAHHLAVAELLERQARQRAA